MDGPSAVEVDERTADVEVVGRDVVVDGEEDEGIGSVVTTGGRVVVVATVGGVVADGVVCVTLAESGSGRTRM